MVTDSSSRINEISAELASILEAHISELNRAMKGAEQSTRQIVSTEMEIARYKQLQASMGPELSQLQTELEGLQARQNEAKAQVLQLSQGRDEARADLGRLHQALKDTEHENDSLRANVRKLEEESEVLRRENADLGHKLRTLEENVLRMRKLKEELLASISGLSQQMSAKD